jgi:hypothetical protein
MIIVGGVDSAQDVSVGTTNAVLSSEDPFTQGIAVFDMNNAVFASSYNASAPIYAGPSIVRELYSSGQGTPAWDSTGVENVFSMTNFGSSEFNFRVHYI